MWTVSYGASVRQFAFGARKRFIRKVGINAIYPMGAMHGARSHGAAVKAALS
jgi:hypothetical protein